MSPIETLKRKLYKHFIYNGISQFVIIELTPSEVKLIGSLFGSVVHYPSKEYVDELVATGISNRIYVRIEFDRMNLNRIWQHLKLK